MPAVGREEACITYCVVIIHLPVFAARFEATAWRATLRTGKTRQITRETHQEWQVYASTAEQEIQDDKI